MKKTARLVLAVLLALLVGCAQQLTPGPTQAPTATVFPAPAATASVSSTAAATPAATAAQEATFAPGQGIGPQDLFALVPEERGFTWIYDGSLQSGHEMTLQTVTEENGAKKYAITGTVRSPESEADLDLRIQIIYTVDGSVWVQEKSAISMLESEFDRLEILRAPLGVGESWEQTAENQRGARQTLTCTLESVLTSGESTVYTVRYEDSSAGYFERREITSGLGITAFERTPPDEEETSSPVGYWLVSGGAPGTAATIADWLPPLGQTLRFSGSSGYGYQGVLVMEQENSREIVYRFDGTDGGTGCEFVVRYYYDKDRGTLTEKAVRNERTGEAQVNSVLHNVVLLRFPLGEGASWTHDTMIGGERYSLTARIVGYDAEEGRVNVRYTAEGVPGYPDGVYIEERAFRVGHGMVSFRQLLTGDIAPESPLLDPVQAEEAISGRMFGYSQVIAVTD